MPVPFNLADLIKRADECESDILSEEEYAEDVWTDEVLGPWLKAYALLTHFPDAALDEVPEEDQLAAYRAYAFARLARLHVKRDGCDCMEVDGMDDLLTELDDIAGPETIEALKNAQADANREITKLKKAGKLNPVSH